MRPSSGLNGYPATPLRLLLPTGDPLAIPLTTPMRRKAPMAAGNTYKQCGCRGEGGKRLGKKCPKLRRSNGSWSPAHGRWYYQLELPPRAGGTRRPPLRRGGFTTQTDAERELDQARELLAIAVPGDT